MFLSHGNAGEQVVLAFTHALGWGGGGGGGGEGGGGGGEGGLPESPDLTTHVTQNNDSKNEHSILFEAEI